MNEKSFFVRCRNAVPVPLLVILALLLFFLALVMMADLKHGERKMMGSMERDLSFEYFPGEVSYESGGGGTVSSPGFMGDDVGTAMVAPDMIPMPPVLEDTGRVAPEGIERQIVYNASLSLLVTRVEDAIASLKQIATVHSGRVENVDFQDSSYRGKKHAGVVLRVPQAEFDATVEAVKGTALKVEHENISSNDVTDQMVDIDARLENLRAEEAQYQKIMEDAQKTEDVLQVSRQLFQVREQIERLEAQKENLKNDVGMSRISVDLSSDPEVQPVPTEWNPWTSVKEAFRAGLVGLTAIADFLIILVILLLPLLILWGLIILFFVWILWKFFSMIHRRLWRSMHSPTPPVHSSAPLSTPRSYSPPPSMTPPAQQFSSKSFPASPSAPAASKRNGSKKASL